MLTNLLPFKNQGLLSMMLFLMKNITSHLVNMIFRNRKYAISLLPLKGLFENLCHQMRAASFDLFYTFCWCNRRPQSNQYMNMIFDTADDAER